MVEITRRMASGLLAQAEKLLMQSQGGSVLNTAFIERLNATFRERKARLTRRSRHAARRLQALETGMYLIGCSYNFCFAHHELSKAKHWGMACTPAMASGLTDHVWSVGELLTYKLAPPPWVEPSRRGGPGFVSERGSCAPSPDSGVLPPAGLFGVPESPEREKKKSFLARIGDMQKIPQKARNDRNGA